MKIPGTISHMYPIRILQAFATETPETEDGRSQLLTVHFNCTLETIRNKQSKSTGSVIITERHNTKDLQSVLTNLERDRSSNEFSVTGMGLIIGSSKGM